MVSFRRYLGWISFPLAPTLITSSTHVVPPALEGLAARDFSQDLYNFNDVTHTLNAMGAIIGIPISAVSNLDLKFADVLKLSPLDFCLVPDNYCFTCQRDPSQSNSLVAINEAKILVICSAASESDPEWILVSECKKVELMLLDFLVDLRDRGSRLAVPKNRLDRAMPMNAESLKDGFYTCVPAEGHTTCTGIIPARTCTDGVTTSSESWEQSYSTSLSQPISTTAVTTDSQPLSTTSTFAKYTLYNTTRTAAGSGTKTAWNTTTAMSSILYWRSLKLMTTVNSHSLTPHSQRSSDFSTAGLSNSTVSLSLGSVTSSLASATAETNTCFSYSFSDRSEERRANTCTDLSRDDV